MKRALTVFSVIAGLGAAAIALADGAVRSQVANVYTPPGALPLPSALPLAEGGTAKAITASAGAVLWCDADSFELTSPGTAGQPLVSTGTTAPAFGTSVAALTINSTGADADTSIQSDTNSAALVCDAGAFSGVGAVSVGRAVPATALASFAVDGAAVTATSGQDYSRALVGNTSAVTLAGTNVVVSGLRVEEPNITDPGAPSCTAGQALYVVGAPSECTNNWAINVGGGTSIFQGNIRMGVNAASSGITATSSGGLLIEDQACTSTNPALSNNTAFNSGFCPADTSGIGYYIYGSVPRVTFYVDQFVLFDTPIIQSGQYLTDGPTMTLTMHGHARSGWSSYTWTNAMVAALGATTTGNITVATMPAKTILKNAYVVLTGAGAGVTTLTVSVGRTSTDYVDYIVASDAKAAAPAIYGNASGERGTNLTGYDWPSYSATTAIVAQFISSGANLSAVTGCTGVVYLETSIVP